MYIYIYIYIFIFTYIVLCCTYVFRCVYMHWSGVIAITTRCTFTCTCTFICRHVHGSLVSQHVHVSELLHTQNKHTHTHTHTHWDTHTHTHTDTQDTHIQDTAMPTCCVVLQFRDSSAGLPKRASSWKVWGRPRTRQRQARWPAQGRGPPEGEGQGNCGFPAQGQNSRGSLVGCGGGPGCGGPLGWGAQSQH